MQPLDLYLNVSQNITISCSGKNEVHLSGYFEPNNSLDDAMYGQEEMDDDDDEGIEGKPDSDSEDSQEVEVKQVKKEEKVNKEKKKENGVQGFEKGGDLEKSLKAAKENAKKNSKQKVEPARHQRAAMKRQMRTKWTQI